MLSSQNQSLLPVSRTIPQALTHTKLFITNEPDPHCEESTLDPSSVEDVCKDKLIYVTVYVQQLTTLPFLILLD